LGKGYLINANDLAMGYESQMRGLGSQWETAALAGDYHNGPLSLVIPLGGLGVLAFVAFLVAGGRALYLNYRNGIPELKIVNRFLLAYFCVRIFHYVVIFGSFYLDLFVFTGLVGLSLSLNGGVQKSAPEPETEPVVVNEEFAWSEY
jgi:O-antigen ligase